MWNMPRDKRPRDMEQKDGEAFAVSEGADTARRKAFFEFRVYLRFLHIMAVVSQDQTHEERVLRHHAHDTFP